MNERRLLMLAEFFETAELPGDFEMSKWGIIREKMPKNLTQTPECRTAACALGWATTIPSFRRAGLTGTFVNGKLQICFGNSYDEIDIGAAFFDIGYGGA